MAPKLRNTSLNLSKLILQALLAVLIGSTILLLNGRGTIFSRSVSAEQIPLASVLPRLESLHEEVKLLLIKNSELRDKILAALQAQNLAKMSPVQAGKLSTTPLDGTVDNATMTTSSASAKPTSNSERQSTNETDRNNKQQQHNGAPTMSPPQQQQQSNRNNSTGTSANKPSMSAPSSSSLTMKQNKYNPGDPSNRSMIDFNELDDFNKWVEMNLEYAFKNTQASAEALKEEAQQNNGTVDYSDQAIKDGLEGIKYWQSAVMFQDKTLKNEKFDPVDERDTN